MSARAEVVIEDPAREGAAQKILAKLGKEVKTFEKNIYQVG
jgi:hypothetical protein